MRATILIRLPDLKKKKKILYYAVSHAVGGRVGGYLPIFLTWSFVQFIVFKNAEETT